MKINTIFLALIVTFSFSEIDAQIREKLNFGVGLDFGSEVNKSGLDVRAGYFIIRQINLVADINYFFVDEGARYIKSTYWNEYNLNALYYLDYNFRDKLLAVYGLAGFNLSTLGTEFEEHPTFGNTEISDNRIGLNIGGGVDFNISKNLKPFIEVKYLLIDEIDQVEIAFGMKYVF